jgi:hypothetical protein
VNPWVCVAAMYLFVGMALSAATTIIVKRQRRERGTDHWCWRDNVAAVSCVFLWWPILTVFFIKGVPRD